jgi:hypothetical protein
LGERLLCKQEVVGSIPITSTTERAQLVSTARTIYRSSRAAPAVRLHRESGGRRGDIDRE